jgi:hypothetical protein
MNQLDNAFGPAVHRQDHRMSRGARLRRANPLSKAGTKTTSAPSGI